MMSGASRWLEWFDTTTKGPRRPARRSRPSTVTVASRQTSGLSIRRWATKRALAWIGDV